MSTKTFSFDILGEEKGIGKMEKCSIGETAELSGISVQTLRYYDRINLLKPEQVQLDNGYRYYSKKNITSLLLIKQLRRLDFPLDKIKKIITAGNSKLIEQTIEERVKELNIELEQLQIKLEAARNLQLILAEGNHFPDSKVLTKIVEREYASRYVIATRRNMSCVEQGYIQRYSELINIADEYHLHITGEFSVKFFGRMYELNPKDADVEIGVTVLENESICPFFKYEKAFIGISRLFKGSYEQIKDGYTDMPEYAIKKGYKIPEFFMFRYLVNQAYTFENKECITDIILPIKK